MTHEELKREFHRVFGSCLEDHRGRLGADGWPGCVLYDADLAVPVLRQFTDGHGLTERGDAGVCSALEDAGAVDPPPPDPTRDPDAGQFGAF